MSDRFGRRPAAIVACVGTAAACMAGAAAPSAVGFAGARALMGFCAAGLPVASFILGTEFVGPDVRGRCVMMAARA